MRKNFEHGKSRKKLIICCDGTWNRPERKGSHKKFKATNVLKLMRAVRSSDDDGRCQVTYYDPGVGTDRGLYDKYIGGLLGLGLSSHVKKAYRFLANNYEQGDELFFFGFSRGAYTVRVLSAFIGTVGLLRPSDLATLPEVFSYFRTRPDKREHSKYHHLVTNQLQPRRAPIKFLGVWDTVGALGVPIPLLKWTSMWRVGFFNAGLGDHVEYAYHALAIDERRRPFAPNLWTQVETSRDRPLMTRDVCQVWFPGVHSDIGGGQKDARLSDEALAWMVNRASDCGIAFDSHHLPKKEENPVRYAGNLQDSFTFLYKLLCVIGVLPYKRPIERLVRPNILQRLPKGSWLWKPLKWIGVTRYQPGLNEMIHDSAQKRLKANPSTYWPHYYQPANLEHALQHVPVFIEDHYHKRDHHRQQVDWIAHISDGKDIGKCQVVNFSSRGGACIKDVEQIAQGSSNRVFTLILPGEAGTRQGRVVWENGQNVGLQFERRTQSSSLIYTPYTQSQTFQNNGEPVVQNGDSLVLSS